jgi:hypothetical protein
MKMNDDELQHKTFGKPFETGDVRINRSGRPRSFDEFRRIAQEIADEPVIGAAGDTLSRAESILRSWAKSKVPQLQMAFIQYCYGAPPTKIETNALQPGTTLRLYYAHERPDLLEPHEREKVEQQIKEIRLKHAQRNALRPPQ